MKLSEKTTSFLLTKTNPKITGNIKITVDSNGLIWLNSIDSNANLASNIFKKYKITGSSSFEMDIKKFAGTLSTENMFFVKENRPDPENTSNTFQDQYDFFYNSGAQNNISNFYDEEYSYFAPLWLRDELPDYFVLFRLDEPLDFPYNKNVLSGDLVQNSKYIIKGDLVIRYGSTLYTNNQSFVAETIFTYTIVSGTGSVILLDENKDLPIDRAKQFESIVKRGQIIKTFDLTTNSKIGSYIRTIVNGNNFPAAPLSVRFDDGLMTTWNGISYKDGSMTEKGELLQDYWSDGQLQIDFEEYITKGFERHGIICPYLLNLEFLFDDLTAPIYSIPRYFGFYVSKIEMAKFQLDGDALYKNSNISGNLPIPKRNNKGYRDQTESFFQSNSNGVKLYYTNEIGDSSPINIPSSDYFNDINFQSRFYWIQDKIGNFYSLDQTLNNTYNIDPLVKDLVIRDKSVDLSLFTGPGKVRLQAQGNKLSSKGRSYMIIEIKEQLFPNDLFYLYWNLGQLADSNGKYSLLRANDLSKRDFNIPAGGTLITFPGMDLTGQYQIGQSIQINYGIGLSVTKIISSIPNYSIDTTFSIDSPIDLITTTATTPIVLGWGPGSALISDDNITIYYHPYGTVTQIATAIANALNLIESKTFDAIVIDDQIVIRMRHGEKAPNSFFMKAQLSFATEVSFQKNQFVSGTKYYFEGGTDVASIRLKFPYADTDNLKNGELYLKTKRGLSKIDFVGRYVDESVEALGSSSIGDLLGFREFGVLYIENLLDEPTITNGGDFIVYELYNIPVGLFTIFGVKEMDGDFFSSTYSRSPFTETYRYFNIQPETPGVLVTGRKYIVKGDSLTDSISYLGNTYVTGNTFIAGPDPSIGFSVVSGTPIIVPALFHQAMVQPNTPLDSSHYLVIGDPTASIIIISSYSHVSASFNGTLFTPALNDSYTIYTGNPLVIDTQYVIDNDLKNFPGFWTLKDLTDGSIPVDSSSVVFNNVEKFIHYDIPSEYDYLKENYSKEESVKSRVMTSISKWVYKDGMDIRDNPYRLNTHPVFGSMSFSPSFIIKGQVPEGFSHEWYYLEQPPQQYSENFDKDNYYFFYDRFPAETTSPDFLSNRVLMFDANPNSIDYFTDYFTFLPAKNTPNQERYSIFNYNAEIGLCETLFRGVKIRIKEIIKETKISQVQSIKPPFRDQSTKYDGYKFSVLLRPFKQDNTKVESPIKFNVIENATHKTILFLIDVILEDYRTLTMIDPNNVGSYTSPHINYPESNSIDISIDYLSLYSIKSKQMELVNNDFSNVPNIHALDGFDYGDVKLSVGLNLSSPSGITGGYIVINVFDNPDYDWDMRDEIKNFNKENIIKGSFFYGETLFPYPLSVNQNQILFGIPGNTYNGNTYSAFTAPSLIPSVLSIPYGSQFAWEYHNLPHTQIHAGYNYFEPIMQKLSFGRIADKINSYDKHIKYTSYVWNTNQTVTIADQFYLEFVDHSVITKKQAIIPQIDEDKPEEFSNVSIIGVNYIKVPYFHELYRYSGPYEPKFKDILFYSDQKTDSINSIDLSYSLATLNPRVDKFGVIENLGIMKVAYSDVLSLINNPKYKSRYPLLDEVPIDKTDFFSFQSNWDPGYWRIYSTKNTFFPQAGTREMLESKNFFGTKIMKTHTNVRLETMTIEPPIVSLDQINLDNFNGEIVYAVVNGKIQALINVKKRLLRFLLEDGASTEFNKYLIPEFGTGDPSSLTDDIVEYLTLNVLPTYEVKIVDLFIRKYKQNLGLDLVRGDITDVQKLQNSYLLDKNFTVTKVSEFVYSFTYTLDNSFNVSLSPSLTIGKI